MHLSTPNMTTATVRLVPYFEATSIFCLYWNGWKIDDAKDPPLKNHIKRYIILHEITLHQRKKCAYVMLFHCKNWHVYNMPSLILYDSKTWILVFKTALTCTATVSHVLPYLIKDHLPWLVLLVLHPSPLVTVIQRPVGGLLIKPSGWWHGSRNPAKWSLQKKICIYHPGLSYRIRMKIMFKLRLLKQSTWTAGISGKQRTWIVICLVVAFMVEIHHGTGGKYMKIIEHPFHRQKHCANISHWIHYLLDGKLPNWIQHGMVESAKTKTTNIYIYN